MPLSTTTNPSHSHLALEVISNPGQSDCNRVLLQATCPARLGNVLLGPVRSLSRGIPL